MKLDDQVHLLGIRHHGPGCASALIHALEALQPDAILLEGAKELETGWQEVLKPDMRPPVAQLVYDPKNPRHCSLYPWADFSPEWQAMLYAGRRGIALRMIDLPAAIRFALETPDDEVQASGPPAEEANADTPPEPEDAAWSLLPLNAMLAETGIANGDAWWDHYVEHHQGGLASFAAIAELMRTAREARPAGDGADRRLEALREAWMRRELRAARKEFRNIAVVCGAWHVPALAGGAGVRDDAALLKGLKRLKVEQAWIPYSYQRLSVASGYGAGVEAPGWYEHLFVHLSQAQSQEQLAIAWLVRVAACLRGQGFLASSAQVIDAVRLALGLARLRQLHTPGLAEMLEAAQAVMTDGSGAALEVIRQPLLIGEQIGALPADSPMLPLEQDLNATLKALRLKRTEAVQQLQLDLRQPIALQRSQLFNRLDLLDIPWARGGQQSGTGTSRETWTLRWQPEFAIGLLDASLHGSTLERAAASKMAERLEQADSAGTLVETLDLLLRCHLPEMVAPAIRRLADACAVSADMQELMRAALRMAQIVRYGSVRSLSGEGLLPLIETIGIRVEHGLAPACTAIDEDSALGLLEAMDAANSAFGMLDQERLLERWQQSLLGLWRNERIHPLIQGRVGRMLLAGGLIEQAGLEQRFRLALSFGGNPLDAAAWIEGMLVGGEAALLYDTSIFGLLDQWVCQLAREDLLRVLPVVRRAFAAYSSQNLRQIGLRVAHGGSRAGDCAHIHDEQLAMQALDSLGFLLGLTPAHGRPGTGEAW